MKRITALMLPCLLAIGSYAQNVAVNTDGSSADASALLDVKSNSKGILIPRMTMAQRDAITSPQNGLMIFQTDGINGFYYNAGTTSSPVWSRVGDMAYPTSNSNRNPYYAAGVNSFTVPSNVYRIYFEMVGGGGGSGGTYNPSSGFTWGGGGGGGGAFAAGYITVTPGEILTLTVGAGGANGITGGTSPTAGTTGSASSIVSGATTIVTSPGGNGGAAGSAAGAGSGGIAAFAILNTPSRCVLSSYVPQVFPGGTGLGIGAPSGLQLNGTPGTVSRTGDYNILARIPQGVAGGGSTDVLMPWYGMGGGYGSTSRQGYVVISW